jgi:ABC-type polysaccharide/polyol phosphate transport system ATPase subunit
VWRYNDRKYQRQLDYVWVQDINFEGKSGEILGIIGKKQREIYLY